VTKRTALAVLLFAASASAFGQSTADTRASEATRYPQLIRAELPLYPPIAQAAHISGKVEIQVTVEKGAVVDAQAKSVDVQISDPEHRAVYDDRAKAKVSPYLSNPSLANVKTWQFKPGERTTFLVEYVYRIEGEATVLPENPKIELDLPHLVTITARPLKPSCSDCTGGAAGAEDGGEHGDELHLRLGGPGDCGGGRHGRESLPVYRPRLR
jgi:hypothetical protein